MLIVALNVPLIAVLLFFTFHERNAVYGLLGLVVAGLAIFEIGVDSMFDSDYVSIVVQTDSADFSNVQQSELTGQYGVTIDEQSTAVESVIPEVETSTPVEEDVPVDGDITTEENVTEMEDITSVETEVSEDTFDNISTESVEESVGEEPQNLDDVIDFGE